MTADAGGLAVFAAGLPASFTLRARYVLPMTGQSARGQPCLDNGWVRVARGRIAALGRGRRAADGPLIDCGEAILVPGFVNAHTHLEFSLCERPLEADGGLPGWIGRVVALRRGRGGDVAARQLAIVRGLAESAAAGVTAIGEIATAIGGGAGLAASYPQAGPRLRVFREALGLSSAGQAAALAMLAADLAGLAAAGIPSGISPHAPYSVASGLGGRLVAAAVKRGLPVAMHLAESREEAMLVESGCGPFRDLLAGLGAWPDGGVPLIPAADWISWLARASRGLVVHGTFLPDDPLAMARLERHRDRLAVAVCPRTTLSLSGRLPPVGAFLDRRVRVAIGTDSRASNPDLDVRGECRTLVEGGVVSPQEALWMATRGGAFALGFERRCGRLAAGFAADIAVLEPEAGGGGPFAAAIAATTRVTATLRRGRPIAATAVLSSS